MKVSFVTTVLNEEGTIMAFLESVVKQTKKPDEVIVVDGGSTDKTLSVMSNFPTSSRSAGLRGASKIKSSSLKFKVLQKSGNRSVGRNEGIQQASGDIILVSDAGCTLDRNWVKRISEPFVDPSVDVVAGYYAAKPKTVFEECLVPFVLVMPDKLNPATFLPATRSMALRKRIWKKAGGFDEVLPHNEDYVFAKELKSVHARIVFKQDAIVYWQPRNNLIQAFIMFFRFALGDAEASIVRSKVIILLLRYVIGSILLLFVLSNILSAYLFFLLLLGYVFWAILKNYHYVRDNRAFLILPLLQITADIAVICGTMYGFIKSLWDIQKQH